MILRRNNQKIIKATIDSASIAACDNDINQFERLNAKAITNDTGIAVSPIENPE